MAQMPTDGRQLADASLAQLVARRSHNPKVVSSILTGPMFFTLLYSFRVSILCQCARRAARPFERIARQTDFRDSIVVSISACHADDPGSIPGRGVYFARFRPECL